MNKVWVWVGFPIGIGIFLLLLVVLGSGGSSAGVQYRTVVTRDGAHGKLGFVDTKVGNGRTAKKGDLALVYYTGKFKNGKIFDSNKGKGKPMEVPVGQGAVIPGFDDGLVGMKVGGVRQLVIPPELGYGVRGAPPQIPPNAELHFEIELVRLEDQGLP